MIEATSENAFRAGTSNPQRPASGKGKKGEGKKGVRYPFLRLLTRFRGLAVGGLDGLIGNAHDFYRAWGVARHVFRHATKQETLHAFSPVGTQNDEICT